MIKENPKTVERALAKKEQRLTTKQMGGMVLASVSLLSALVNSGCGAKTVESTPRETPSIENTSTGTSTTSTENVVDKYESSMDKYRNMDIATFEALPRDDRLQYAQFLVDQSLQRGNYNTLYGEGTKRHDRQISQITVSKDNSGQEILDSNRLVQQIAYIQFVECDKNPKPFDSGDGQKALSAAYYNVYDIFGTSLCQLYLDEKQQMQTLALPSTLGDKETPISTSGLKSGKDKDGNTVEYRDITYASAGIGKNQAARFVYHEFTSYDGTKKAVWLIERMGDDPKTVQYNSEIR